jgi:hypothetical protein
MDSTYTVGQRVEVRYKGRSTRFYPGEIGAVNHDTSGQAIYDIRYDDGDRETGVLAENIRPMAETLFTVGQRVEVRFRGRGVRFYAATITDVVTDTSGQMLYNVEYDDKDIELNILPKNIRPVAPRVVVVDSPRRPRSISRETPESYTSGQAHEHGEPSVVEHVQQYMYGGPQKRSLNVERSPNKRNQLMTFEEVQRILTNIYNQEQAMRSTTLDIICAYLRGQKVLYVEAKTYCEMYLYALMLPTISITALCSILSILLQTTPVGAPLVSCLGALNSFLLALITYLKLDGKAEAHRTTAYGYEKLQSFCEFNSGKILLMPTGKSEEEHQTNLDSVDEVIHEIEAKVKEIKETNHFILPEYIRYSYPTLYSMNVFAEVKKLMNKETILINKLKININRIIELENSNQDTTTAEYQEQYETLQKEQNVALEEIIGYRNTYLEIDDKFNTEIDNNRKKAQARRGCCCTWLKT